MNLYPCTKQPTCTNVTGHRTPVCPNDTSSIKSSVSKLKTEAMLEHEPIRISYHDNSKVAYEEWELGKGPEGLSYRSYHDNGKIASEGWESGKGPDGLEYHRFYTNGKTTYEVWEPGKGPDGLECREYHTNGKIAYERWGPGKGPDGLECRKS